MLGVLLLLRFEVVLLALRHGRRRFETDGHVAQLEQMAAHQFEEQRCYAPRTGGVAGIAQKQFERLFLLCFIQGLNRRFESKSICVGRVRRETEDLRLKFAFVAINAHAFQADGVDDGLYPGWTAAELQQRIGCRVVAVEENVINQLTCSKLRWLCAKFFC